MARTVVLVNVVGNHWNVIEGDRICEMLGADEALGMCARLLLNTQFPPYPMLTLAELADRAVERAERSRVTVSSGWSAVDLAASLPRP